MDFKTGRPPRDPSEIPEHHLKQLAIYRALLLDLYPEREVEAMVVWTALPQAVDHSAPPARRGPGRDHPAVTPGLSPMCCLENGGGCDHS